MSCKDPYACGPQCSCDPCDKPRPLEVVVTAGPPQGEPNPCDNLPIAYDATNGCFYLWEENTGWFEASGISFEVADTDPNGTGDRLILTKCGENTVFFNSRNTAIRLEHRGTSDNDGAEWLVLEQTHGPDVEVNLSDLDSYVTNLSLNNGNHVLTLTQNQGKPNQTVDLTYLKQTETDNTITGDGTADDPLSVNWDAICPGSDTVANIPDNALMLYCSGGQVEKTDFRNAVGDAVNDHCFNPNDTGQSCGDLSYAVWQQCPEGGYKLASFSTDNAVSFSLFPRNVPWLPNDQNLIWPISPEFQNGDGPYSLAQLRADDDFGAGTVDETRMRNNIVAEATIELACPTSFDFDTVASVNTASVPDVAAAYSMRVHLIHRWSVDGGPWTYRRIPNDNRISGTIPDNAVQQSVSGSQSIGRLRLPAGNVRIQLLLLTGEVLDPVPINVNTTEPNTGTANINQRFTQAVG